MQLTCSLCPETFKSVILDKDAALNECVNKLATHVSGKHADLVTLYNKKLQDVMSNVAGRFIFTMFTNLSVIDEEDARQSHILINLEKNEEELIQLLGLGEEEEELEENDKEKQEAET